MNIMSSRLANPFIGAPHFQCIFKKPKPHKKACYKCIPRARKSENDWISHGIRFCGENVAVLWKNIGLRSGFVVKSVKGPFTRSRTLVRSLSTVWLWEEGLFVFRCSVFCAVISGVCLLLWYGQRKAKTLVESKLLPSVCTSLSDYIQRDLHFGKVARISPLSITLESCSIGPHKEEFSCGEVPTLKLRFHPFSSLRRGKIVVDAVLSNPTLLVAQKRDYSWLGIPFSDGVLQKKRLSTEEGIDNRTKIRRIAREQTAARMDRDRDDAAQEAARTGYIVSSCNENQGGVDVDIVKKNGVKGLSISELVFSADDKLDHRCMDAGVEYDMKHADLEKSFGVSMNIPTAGVKFWPGPFKRKKRKVNGRDMMAAAKKRILEHSASAAHAYFLDPPSVVDIKDDYQIEEPDSDHHKYLDALVPPKIEDEDMETKQQLSPSFQVSSYTKDRGMGMGDMWSYLIVGPIRKIRSHVVPKVEEIVGELIEGANGEKALGIDKMVPVVLDSVHFKGGTLLLLAYGDNEPREMENASGHVKFQNNYSRVHVQLSGSCKMWRCDVTSEDGGWLSTDVFVDTVEQNWHANLKVVNLFIPLFERILEIPIAFYEGRASGEVHICMSQGESFPNLHGQLDVTGMAFQISDAPSSFSDASASLCFRAQRIFLHNVSGWFGKVPLEASGDFGIEPEEGEFHLMFQVPSVEVNALMKSFKMKPLLFPLAGSVTAVFNCQGPLDAPIFVGSGLVSRKMSSSVADVPTSAAYDAIMKNKEAGAVAAFDRVPFSYVSANFTFNTDNCVADLYGIRASLVDGGEIRGAGNAWICPEGEEDETAMDVNFSGSLCFDKIMDQYVGGYNQTVPFKLGDLNGETKLSGSLLKPRFDIKWTAPKAEGSFGDARGDMIISHDFITITSSSIAFELFAKVETSYPCENSMPVVVEGVELDLRMRGFEFFNLVSSYAFDSLRPIHLKATGRVKFQGKVVKPAEEEQDSKVLAGDVSITGLKLNQLMLAPHLAGVLNISPASIKLDATGRPDESLAVEVIGPLQSIAEDNIIGNMLSFSLQKGQLRVNVRYQPFQSANLEVRHLPLDELELASLRGTLQRAELQLNFQKRRGHGILSLLHPKFSGVLGEALDVAARWSGDVITVEKAVLEQSNSQYELQGEYVLPGSRNGNESGNLLRRAMAGHLGSVISSMGRWRMRLEVPRAEIAEMLPLARLVSRSTDPALQFRSKDLFIQSIQSVGVDAESLQKLLEEIRGHSTPSDEVILEELSLPGLAELKGRWRGSLDASGGGNGDTMADFDFQGEEWEWGSYKTQRVLAAGAYSNDDGLRLEKMFIQRDNATIHADGTLLGPKTNLHFAVLNFPVSLVPTLVQVLESSANEAVQSLRQLLAPIKGILHMEGDLRGSLAKPECDVQVRLLDGAIGGIDLGRAEIVASLTSTSRFLFNAKFEPIIQNGHVHIQGSVPLNLVQDEENIEKDKTNEASWAPGWSKEPLNDKKASWNEQGWDTQLAESLKGLHWNVLDVGEVRVDADVKDGGMMLLTALSPYANWLNGSAEVMLQVRGTVEQPMLDGSASFHRATISSPILRKPLTNFGGIILMDSNRLCIRSLESRVSRKGKLSVKGNLPLRTTEASLADKIDLKCEVLEVRAKNMLSGQVDTQLQVTGSILQPNISGNIKLSHGEAYLPHEKGGGAAAAAINREASDSSNMPSGGYNQVVASKYVSRFLNLKPATSVQQPSGKETEVVKKGPGQVNSKPKLDIRLTDLRLVLGPELRIVYPLILNFAVSGELELNGIAHPKLLKPKGVLMFENGDVNLVATQVRLKREHLNTAKFEADYGLDPMLDLALVGSEWQFRIQSRATKWQDNLVVTSTRSVEQDVLSPSEAARVFESQLAESILEGDGQLAFKKLATATLETLMPRIEGKGEFGHARWRLVYAPQIPSLLSVDPTVDPLKSLASNISFGTEVEVQLGKRLQASVVRQMKDSEMAMQWTLIYQLTSRLRLLLQSAPSKRMLFEYSTTSQA